MLLFQSLVKLVGVETQEQQYENFLKKNPKEQEKIIMKKRIELLYKYNIDFEKNQVNCGLVGLENVGHTCHLNSILQVFFNTIPLSKLLIEQQSWKKQLNPYSQKSQGNFTCAYFILLKKIWKSHDCFICPIQFCKILQDERILNLKKYKKNIPVLINKFVEFLSQDLNRNITNNVDILVQQENLQDTLAQNLIWFHQKLDSPLNNIFYGQTVFEYNCQGCETRSFQIDNFFKLNPKVEAKSSHNFSAYLIKLCNGQKIYEVDFSIDPQSTLQDAVQHILLQSGNDSNIENFELFLYLNFYQIEKIQNHQNIKLKDLQEKKKVLFIVETCCNGLKDKFDFKDVQDLVTLSIKVFHRNQMISVEQILKFKKNITKRELYDLFVYLYYDQIKKNKNNDFTRHYFETEEAQQCVSIFLEGQEITDSIDLQQREKKYSIDVQLNQNIFTQKIHFKKADTLNLPNKIKVGDLKIPLFNLIDEQLSQIPNQNCLKCKKQMNSEWKFGYLPQILIVDINRFQKQQNCYYEKNEFFIDFPVKNLILKSNFEGQIIDVKYHLYAVVNMYGGKNDHTDTCCWNNKKKKWFKYDDRNVKQINPRNLVTKDAVALFYEKINQFNNSNNMDLLKKKNYKEINEIEDEQQLEQYFSQQAKISLLKNQLDNINDFNNEYDFLNNFYDCNIFYNNKIYPNVYAAFQASRTENEYFQNKLTEAQTPQDIFDVAIKIDDKQNWDLERITAMERLIRDKFIRNLDLKEKLIQTYPRQLIDSYKVESQANCFWGKVKGKGENQLGQILMRVRKDIKDQTDIIKWIRLNFNLLNKEDQKVEFQLDIQNQLQKALYKNKDIKKSLNFINQKFIDQESNIDDKKVCCFFYDKFQGLIFLNLQYQYQFFYGQKICQPFIPEIILQRIKHRVYKNKRGQQQIFQVNLVRNFQKLKLNRIFYVQKKLLLKQEQYNKIVYTWQQELKKF